MQIGRTSPIINQAPPAVKLLTPNTGSTPVAYIGVDGQSYLGYWNANSEVFFNVVSPDNQWTVDVSGIGVFRVTGDGTVGHGGISRLLGIATNGTGVPCIFQDAANKNLSGASTNFINYTTVSSAAPDNASKYRIYGCINVLSWTTPASFTLQLGYTDDSGGARTETLGLSRGSTGATAAAITAIDRWYFSVAFRAATATAITLSTTGTFTGSPSYNETATLEQLGY